MTATTGTTVRGAGSAHAAANDVGLEIERWLVAHITQGITPAELARARALGYEAYLEEQLDYESLDDSAIEAQIAATLPSVAMTAKQLYDTYIVNNQQQVPEIQLKVAMVLRSVFSPRQLFERMCEFWTDHFSMDQADQIVGTLKTVDDRDVIRQHALGNFPDLLRASAHSPAMLHYLDNYANVAGAPQENYSRELMELHALGVDGPYTETDVVEVARCLTGWTYFQAPANPLFGTFRFANAQHDAGAKTVLGVPITAGGVQDGEQVLDLLARHPSTARFVGRKLAAWLLAYEPSDELVDRVADVYLATGGDIRAMVREILSLRTIAEERPWLAPKLKRPFHFVTGLLRQTGATIQNPVRVLETLAAMGQLPFAWPAPNGYPDALGAWGSSLLPRWEAASDLTSTGNGVTIDLAGLFATVGGFDVNRVGEQIAELLTGGALPPDEQALVQAFVSSQPTVTLAVVREALALAASLPGYQLY